MSGQFGWVIRWAPIGGPNGKDPYIYIYICMCVYEKNPILIIIKEKIEMLLSKKKRKIDAKVTQ